MFLKSLYLKDFRCYSQDVFHFSDGINIVQGANAEGKTSLLEAIYLLISGRSFRTSNPSDLIKKDGSQFQLEAVFQKHDVDQTVAVIYGNGERSVRYNSTLFSSFSHLLGLLPGVVLSPDDMALVKGAPQVRRQFLDMQLAQTDPLYVHHLMRYQRAMRHRNALLKSKSELTMDVWETEMARSAAYIVCQRILAVEDLNVRCNAIYLKLTDEKESLAFAYKSATKLTIDQPALCDEYLRQFRHFRKRELMLGTTLNGPHKDDLLITIGKKEARYYASEGQQRGTVAVMRLGEWERMQQLVAVPPLLLIDDVGISLDAVRQARLLDHVASLGQLFMSTTQLLEVNSNKRCERISVCKERG